MGTYGTATGTVIGVNPTTGQPVLLHLVAGEVVLTLSGGDMSLTGTLEVSAAGEITWAAGSGIADASQFLLEDLEADNHFRWRIGGSIGTSATDDLSFDGVDDIRYSETLLTWKAANTELDANGNLIATNATLSGTITASAGDVGGWTINSTYLAKDTGTDATSAGLAPTDYPFYAGSTYANRASAPFRVTPAGALVASSATITGALTTGAGSSVDGQYLVVQSVTSAKIAANTIVAGNIAANTITAAEIAAGAIATDELAANAVTAAKISVSTLSAIAADMGSLTAGSIVIGTTDKLWLNDSADGALNIGGATKASAPFRVTSAGALTATNATITGTITASAGNITGTLEVSAAGEITWAAGSGIADASQFLLEDLEADNHFRWRIGGSIGTSATDDLSFDGVDDIRYSETLLTWKAANTELDANGNLIATNATLSGTITASAGSVGGWTINSTYLAKDTGTDATSAGLAPTDYPFYAGATYANRATAPFRVTPAGALVASGATVIGTITASAGSITGALEIASGGYIFGMYDATREAWRLTNGAFTWRVLTDESSNGMRWRDATDGYRGELTYEHLSPGGGVSDEHYGLWEMRGPTGTIENRIKAVIVSGSNAGSSQILQWVGGSYASFEIRLGFSASTGYPFAVQYDGSDTKVGFLGATPAARQSHIADPTGGGTADAEARTAINSILSVLETFGFTATS